MSDGEDRANGDSERQRHTGREHYAAAVARPKRYGQLVRAEPTRPPPPIRRGLLRHRLDELSSDLGKQRHDPFSILSLMFAKPRLTRLRITNSEVSSSPAMS